MTTILGLLLSRWTILIVAVLVVVALVSTGRLLINRYVIGGLIVLALGFGLWTWHDKAVKDDRVATAKPYIAQLAEIARLGEVAQAAAKEKTRIDIAAKRMADDENKTTTDTHNTIIVRLRSNRAGSRYLPAPAPGAASPATATIDRAEFERAVGELDRSVQGIVDAGDKAVIDLNTAKLWAKARIAETESGGIVLAMALSMADGSKIDNRIVNR